LNAENEQLKKKLAEVEAQSGARALRLALFDLEDGKALLAMDEQQLQAHHKHVTALAERALVLPHRIASHRIASHRIASHRIVWHHNPPACVRFE
jgi:hypothetical protein